MNELLKAEIKIKDGAPTLYIDGEEQPFINAYVTYFSENNNYLEFAKLGYRVFSVCVGFSKRPINTRTDVEIFKDGIFEEYDKTGTADFSLLDKAILPLLKACPNALIFPRLNLALPKWWEDLNQDECNTDGDGKTNRESFYSEVWLKTVSGFLKETVNYLKTAPYSSHILGIQIADGNTEEWFHFDLCGGNGKPAESAFAKFLKDECGMEYNGLPDFTKPAESWRGKEYTLRYFEFCNQCVPKVIAVLAKIIKETTQNRWLVGCFYGYLTEVVSPLWGTHGLELLLNCPDIDFFSSPLSYVGGRKSGAEWCDMSLSSSIKKHCKMVWTEADVRTTLTKYMKDSRQGADIKGKYVSPIWKGPEKMQETLWNMRKVFAKQFINGNGFWWFDMWGGWYNSPEILRELQKQFDLSPKKVNLKNQVALIVDEKVIAKTFGFDNADLLYSGRQNLAKCNALYDAYHISDFMDIAKDVDGHMVAVPKKHVKNILDCDEQTLSALMNSVKKVSVHCVERCGYDGVNLLNASDESAGQSVGHFHIHIIPRKKEDGIDAWPVFSGAKESMEDIFEKLKM